MEKDDFLITTIVNGRSWQVLWDNEDPLELDHPVYWELRHVDEGIALCHKTDDAIYVVPSETLEGEAELEIPEFPGEDRQFSLQMKRLQKIRPAFLTNLDEYGQIGPAEFYFSTGIREFLIAFRAFDENGVAGTIADQVVFDILYSNGKAQVVAKVPGIRFKLPGEHSKPLPVGGSFLVTPDDLVGGAFIYGNYWWRVNKVSSPEMIDLDELEEELQEQDLIQLKSLKKGIGGFLLAALLVMRVLYFFDFAHVRNVAKAPPPTEVELKKPKIIPMQPVPPPPKVVVKEPEKKKEPPKVVKVEPKPKPKPAPKIAKVQPKPKVQKAPPKIAKHEAPKPQKKAPAPVVAKAPPKQVQAAPAPKVAKQTPPPVKTPPPPDPAVVAAQQRALETAKEKSAVAKSLNFLSTGPSKNVAALASSTTGKASAKYKNAGSGGIPSSNSELTNMADHNSAAEGPISTRGSRGIASNSGISGGHGKGLNGVQGKVSLNALYGNGSGDALGAAAGEGGLTVSGSGSLSNSDIEKTLAKYLQKFQYCYEKALLADSSLAGTIQMQWTIESSGAVSGTEVVRSAMNNAGLHSCLKRELGKIRFPSPKGGSVTVRKPFSFQSTTL